MSFVSQLFGNHILWTCVFAWFFAQFIKLVISFIKHKKVDFGMMIESGGMPSSHSAFAVSLSTAIGLKNGFDSNIFAVCVCFALVVMHDAAGVRRRSGEQAVVLNKLIKQWNSSLVEHNLKELLGHTPFEVFAGALVGIITAILRHI